MFRDAGHGYIYMCNGVTPQFPMKVQTQWRGIGENPLITAHWQSTTSKEKPLVDMCGSYSAFNRGGARFESISVFSEVTGWRKADRLQRLNCIRRDSFLGESTAVCVFACPVFGASSAHIQAKIVRCMIECEFCSAAYNNGIRAR